jgi:ParB/RepB/Spo0J family partition protein
MSKSSTARKTAAEGGGAMGLAIESMVITVPIERCTVAPENPRAHREAENVDALRASIEASLADGGPGVLQAGICYEEFDGSGKTAYCFTAGRRRLDAARAAGMTFFPALVMERDAAIRAGLQEQENHIAMHPADQAMAFARELATRSATEIANAYGVSESVVRQRAALANLAPDIFSAFAEDRIDLKRAQAWANAPRERQEAVLARIGPEAQAWQVRDELAAGSVDSDDRLALLVGEAAYKAAGGEVEQDLFAEPEERWHDEEDADEEPAPPIARWTNRELAERLAQEKIDAKVAELKADGWGWVETGETLPYGRFDKKPAPKKKAERADFGCFVEITWRGELTVHKALVVVGNQRGPNASPTQGDAPKPDVGAHAHLVMTTAATRAVQFNLCTNPNAALPVLLARMARDHFSGEAFMSSFDEIVGLHGRQHDGGARDVRFGGEKLWDGLRDTWKEKLKGQWNTAEVAISKWPTKVQLEFLAFLTAASLSGVEGAGAGQSELRRYRLAFAGRISGLGEGPKKVSPADTWTPDARWFAGCSKAHRLELATVLGVDNTPTTKVAALCAMLADKAEQLGWVPPLMRQLTGCVDLAAPEEPDADDDFDFDDQTDLEEFTSDAPPAAKQKREVAP